MKSFHRLLRIARVSATIRIRTFAVASLVILGSLGAAQGPPKEELSILGTGPGESGGVLTVAQRVEPKTLNPVMAIDVPSREVIWRMMADLVHINRQSQRTEPALAKSWKASSDGRRYTLALRRGIRFSDGQQFSADDVVFSFQVYLDERIGSPQRDLLLPGGKPIGVRKLDEYDVEFEFAQPYAPAERLFDSVAMLPKHLMEKAYQSGSFTQLWRLDTKPNEIAGLGPFRLAEYVPGSRLVLERNPYYWKADQTGKRLPYLDRIVFLFVGTDDAQVIRFQAGDTDVLNRISAENFSVLEKEQSRGNYRLYDLGPGLEYNFLFFNLNDLGEKFPQITGKQRWFQDLRFRQAVSAAIDRDGIVRLVYRGKATPLWAHVTPGNRLWLNSSLPKPARSLVRARELLKEAGFSWAADGHLISSAGEPVAFSILAPAGNAQRLQMATIIQEDLRQLGMRVDVVGMEFRALVDRVTNTREYEAAVMGLGSGDVDPASEMNVWLFTGSTHLWDLHPSQPAQVWEAEIDRLMRSQLTTINTAQRKALYDRVQALVQENLPVICLASPNILVAAKTAIANFKPAILEHYTLWNADEIYWRRK